MNNIICILSTLRPIFSNNDKIAINIDTLNLSITWYAIIILSGAIIGTLFGYFRYGKRLGLSADLVSEGLALGLLFGVLFARLYYVIFSGVTYNSIIDVINPRNGGLAIHGAVIAVLVYLPIWTKFRHIDLLLLLEIALPLILFAQVVGRWGNFINQEAFGPLIKTNLVTGNESILTDEALLSQREYLHNMLIPNFIIDRMYITTSNAAGFTISGYYHPTFLYESMLNLFGLTLYMILRKFIKQIIVGDGLSFYLIWYGIVRIFIESLRTDPLMIGNIKVAQAISIIMIASGILLIILRRILKIRLTPCKDALYSKNSSLIVK